jgi:hypothetical protein
MFVARARAQPLGELIVWEGATNGPGSQETSSDRQAHTPSWKGVALLLRFIRRALVGALLASSVSAAVASATPVTVNLRVEGSTQTLFEGPVTTDARTLVTTSDPAPGHPCDVADNGPTPPGGTTSGTPTTALYDAAGANGLAFDAQWFGSTQFGDVNDYFVSKVGSDANKGSPGFESWGLAVDYTAVSTGGCQVAATPGMDVLWAYDFFSKVHLLKLTGPPVANAGDPVTLHVVDGQNGSAVQGASVAGTTTDAGGDARPTFSTVGTYRLKAEKSDSVRSNALTVCVHAGNDGNCGTPAPAPAETPPSESSSTTQESTVAPPATPPVVEPDRVAPQGQIDGLADGTVFAHGDGPRELHGRAGDPQSTLRAVTLVPDPSALQAVRLRLTRNDRGRCAYYSGTSERFRRARCGASHGRYFTIGTQPVWSYLLPFRLPRGRYVLDVLAIDKAGNRDDVRRRGGNRVVFRVR